MSPDAPKTTAAALSNRHAKGFDRRGRHNRIKIILIYTFLFSLAAPIIIFIGPLRLSPYRIFLITLFIPCFVLWISRRAGKVRSFDILIILYAIWSIIALLKAHGLGAVEGAGINAIEILGSYFFARCFVRTQKEFEKTIMCFFIIICIFAPLSLIESVTRHNILNEILSTAFSMPPRANSEQRWGLYRATVLFEHPILYGVFCASALGLVTYVLGNGRVSFANFVRSGLVAIATFFSLSAGPLVALASQIYLIGWDKITHRIPRRWAILCGLIFAAYVSVDLLSNRTPVEVFISYLTFSPHTAYQRVLIWDFGTAEVARNPIFGIGLNEWQRPAWMPGSMDNFWLVQAVRYGLPGLGFLVAALIVLGISLARLRLRDRGVLNCRKGWFLTIIGLAIAGSTVHYWNAVYCLFMFLVGSGVWMLDYNLTKKPSRGQAKS